MLGLLAQQFGVEHLVAEEHQRYDLYHAEEVLLPDAHTEHLYYYPSASLNYIQPKGKGDGGWNVGIGWDWRRRGMNYWLANLLKLRGNLPHPTICNPSNAETHPIQLERRH